MPTTPLHLGPALLLAAVFYRWLDLPTVIVSSVIIDVRTGLAMFDIIPGPDHGVATTFLGATAAALFVAAGVWLFRDHVAAATPRQLQQDRTPLTVLLAAVVGTYSHVLLDAVLYADVAPFMPVRSNPFLGAVSPAVLFTVTVAAGIAAVPMLWWRVSRSG